MPTPTLDARPRGVHLRFRPGRTIAVRLAFPAGFVDGHTFTSTLGDETLSVDVDGDDLLVTADETTTTTVGLVTATWLLVMDGEPVLGGLWSGSRSFADSGDVDATVVVEDLSVTVELVGPPGEPNYPDTSEWAEGEVAVLVRTAGGFEWAKAVPTSYTPGETIDDALLLESGDVLTTEAGDVLVLEAA